jgi:UDP-N-acetyl-D-mannosaminuronate dehydrogenase
MKMKHIVIGIRGQIGTCVATFLRGVGEGDIVGVEYGDVVVEGRHYGNDDGSSYVYDMMHVCIPFVAPEQFHGEVSFYMKKYASRYVVVYSTVLPGTCGRLGENVVHSPVEGRHPDLIGGFRTFKRFVAGKAYKPIADFYTNCGLKVVTFGDARISELGKMLSTTRYGIAMLFAAEQERLCKELGLEFVDVVLEYQRMYNEGYKKLKEDRFVQPLIVPPEGKIGGHCVVPNAKLLVTIMPDSDWVKKLARYNG